MATVPDEFQFRRQLERLAHKYRTLAALRGRREELEEVGRDGFPPEELSARKDAFRLIAGEFPGSLRELDTTTGEELRAKAEAVEIELATLAADPTLSAPAAAWIRVVVDYHATLRELLAMKLWLARRIGRDGEVTDDVAADFDAWLATYPHRVSPRTHDLAFLRALHHPPGGRLHPLVWEELAERHGLDRRELKQLVFGEPE